MVLNTLKKNWDKEEQSIVRIQLLLQVYHAMHCYEWNGLGI